MPLPDRRARDRGTDERPERETAQEPPRSRGLAVEQLRQLGEARQRRPVLDRPFGARRDLVGRQGGHRSLVGLAVPIAHLGFLACGPIVATTVTNAMPTHAMSDAV